MTKAELEKYCARIEKEVEFYKSSIYDIQKDINEFMSLFKNGIAEECAYNDGVIATLNYFAEEVNKLSRTKIEPIKVKQDSDLPVFTRIKGGLFEEVEG